MEDNQLIKQALAGDQKAYETLVLRHQEMVARVVVKITHRRDLAPDLTQEIFLKAFQNLARFRGGSGFLTWLYRIAVNTSLESLRREKALTQRQETAVAEWGELPDSLLVQDRATWERTVLDRDRQLEVREALEKLSAETRALLTLRYLEELSTVEMAQVLKMPEGTVRSRLYSARLELAEILGAGRAAGAKAAAGKKE